MLHPAQALLNTFREPQGNFSTMQDFLFHRHTHVHLGVLLTDLQKAFEYVHPIWIQQVLIARQAPLWLLKYAEYTLFGRSCKPKIAGYKLKPICLQVGVDMGSAISPLFFCFLVLAQASLARPENKKTT
jgi:hypothetical protein